jgi:hypothetical protein
MRVSACKFIGGLTAILFFLSLFASLSEASIVLKVVAVNPSKDQRQKVQVKAYLPKETKPGDVMDKDDLDIAYDTQQGSYYVFGEYDLNATEVLEKNIELRDIWNVPEAEIESVRSEALKMSQMLKNTEFSDRAAFLVNNIDSKLNQIIENQKNPAPNPERHISDYRENLKTIESAKADLALVRSFISQVKSLPPLVVWRLILMIIIFLGLLGTSFYFIWQKQLKQVTHDTFYIPPETEESTGEKKPDSPEGGREGKKG